MILIVLLAPGDRGHDGAHVRPTRAHISCRACAASVLARFSEHDAPSRADAHGLCRGISCRHARRWPAAQERPTRVEVWDLKLGSAVEALPDGFAEYACGSNGGPPGAPLGSWREFRRCRAEPDGRHEVYFRYDDELEYWAKGQQLLHRGRSSSPAPRSTVSRWCSRRCSTPRGVLVGLRIVSDPRDPSRRREEAYALRNFITARFGRDGWDCIDHPPADGETRGVAHLHQAGLPQDHRRGRRRHTPDALSAKERPEPVRPPHRPGDRRPVRKPRAVRVDEVILHRAA